MLKTGERPMAAARELIREKLFCRETGLLYDYLSSHEAADRFRFLPSPEEIAASFPNPCGWGTGMEDCALNGGFLMDILRLEGELESNFASEALRGLLSLGTIHGRRGFLVRGISPADGRSCYGNSSRDQFTLAVFGLLSYWRNRTGNPQLRNEAAGMLATVADYCESIAVPENGYNLRRLDGGRAIVSKMWECEPHEAFRLPMIFCAAYEATGEKRYLELIERFARPGIAQTLMIDPNGAWWDMPLIQMQISLHTFRESRILPEWDHMLQEALSIGAGIARSKLRILLEEAERFNGHYDTLCKNWRQQPMQLTRETLSADGRSALFDGKSYLNPCFDSAFSRPNEIIRGMGNYLGSIALAEPISPADPLVVKMTEIISGIDFSRCTGAGPVPLLYSWLLLKNISETSSFDMQLQLQGEGK